MQEILPPTKFAYNYDKKSLFLAGSIEMGTAIDWQSAVVSALADVDGYLFNPRRKDWDASWTQSIDNPQFNEQVNWELKHLLGSTHVLFNFVGGTQSPITLLELGLVTGGTFYQDEEPQEILVICPDNFWRKGNVDIVCERWRIRVEDKFDLDMIKGWINE